MQIAPIKGLGKPWRIKAVALTKGCIRFFPIGYWYGFGVCIEKAVNHKMKPERRSSSESNVDAMMANEPLLTDAYTLAAKRTMFAIFDILMAVVSLLANFSLSSYKQINWPCQSMLWIIHFFLLLKDQAFKLYIIREEWLHTEKEQMIDLIHIEKADKKWSKPLTSQVQNHDQPRHPFHWSPRAFPPVAGSTRQCCLLDL